MRNVGNVVLFASPSLITSGHLWGCSSVSISKMHFVFAILICFYVFYRTQVYLSNQYVFALQWTSCCTIILWFNFLEKGRFVIDRMIFFRVRVLNDLIANKNWMYHILIPLPLIRIHLILSHLMANIIEDGFSIYDFHKLLKRAMVAPSTARWSPPHEIGMIRADSTSLDVSLTKRGRRCILPMAPTATWGGRTTGDMYVPPMAPMLLSVKVHSLISASERFPSKACS